MSSITDISQVDILLQTIDDLSNYSIKVGILGDGTMHGDDEATVLLIATVHEFGVAVKGIPERSFIRAGFDYYRSRIEEESEELLKQVIYQGLPASTFFDALGQIMVGFIQTYLTDLSYPPLQPSTIARKGSSNPLIDTGQLRDSITYEVVENV
jgi:hypothetical protein